MNNKKNGNDFEREFADLLYESGFWVHRLCPNQNGQPADVIAVKNKKAYLIDCKVCSTRKGFDLSRIEDNQDLSMELWRDCGNGEGWFAVKLESQIYMIPHFTVKAYRNQQSAMSPKKVINISHNREEVIEQIRDHLRERVKNTDPESSIGKRLNRQLEEVKKWE